MVRTTKTHLTQTNRSLSNARFVRINPTLKIFLMVILHVALAIALRSFSILATIHALMVFAIGLWRAITANDIKDVVPVAAYITGAEVLWRMTDAGIFWEFGKYATVAIFTLALLKQRKITGMGLPVLFFIVLAPSIVLTVNDFGLSTRTRELISFNLSGPLAVSVCLIFFRQFKVELSELYGWVWAIAYPIISIFTLAAYSTLTASEIYFGTESVFVTSGGYGPNQVSAVLGLGALVLMMWAISAKNQGGRLLALLLALALLTQSFLTFSRGGVYNFTIALAAAILHLMGKPSKFIRGVFVLLIIGIIVANTIIPRLDNFTRGALSQRFSDLDVSSRFVLARADLELFFSNPIFGVGPGMAVFLRQNVFYAAAHTEYTRLLSEHGIGGILALLILIIILIKSYFKAPDILTRAWVVALAAWPIVEMAHAAMRVVGIALLLGMATIKWKTNEKISIEDDASG